MKSKMVLLVSFFITLLCCQKESIDSSELKTSIVEKQKDSLKNLPEKIKIISKGELVLVKDKKLD